MIFHEFGHELLSQANMRKGLNAIFLNGWYNYLNYLCILYPYESGTNHRTLSAFASIHCL
jgi:hypothetical protein